MKQKALSKELLYLKIATSLQQQITKGVLKPGDKLPSIRMICREHGVSMTTAQYAYYELEAKSLITSRPQSGYYVSHAFHKKLDLPEASKPVNSAVVKDVSELFGKAFNHDEKHFTLFARGVPSTTLLPVAKLKKATAQAVRDLPGGGTVYETLQGNEKLRRQVAKWSFSWKGNLQADDIVTTAGCISAISYCLMALTKRGDTIAVESPCFYGILQLAQSLGLKVLELPTSPATGVDMEALKKILQKTKLAACLFVSNFNNPFGSLMPDAHKKEAVKLLAKYHVPLIEDDIYGDLFFGNQRPACCKSYDEEGMVLWCGSVSKTLAPAYRVGWVAAGKYKDAVMKLKLFHSLYNTPVPSEVIGSFLETGRYESHLRKLRHTLHTNYLHYTRVISECFPEGTRISQPQGGLSVWVELPKAIDTISLYNEAVNRKITFSPGRMFTLRQQFGNCMRLSYGMEWNEKTAGSLKLLGKLAKEAL